MLWFQIKAFFLFCLSVLSQEAICRKVCVALSHTGSTSILYLDRLGIPKWPVLTLKRMSFTFYTNVSISVPGFFQKQFWSSLGKRRTRKPVLLTQSVSFLLKTLFLTFLLDLSWNYIENAIHPVEPNITKSQEINIMHLLRFVVRPFGNCLYPQGRHRAVCAWCAIHFIANVNQTGSESSGRRGH